MFFVIFGVNLIHDLESHSVNISIEIRLRDFLDIMETFGNIPNLSVASVTNQDARKC